MPPVWKFTNLEDKLQGYLALIENHYRYYQFYSNMLIAVAFSFAAAPGGQWHVDDVELGTPAP